MAILASTTVTGSLTVSHNIYGNLLGTASYFSGSISNAITANTATSASYSLTASYVSGSSNSSVSASFATNALTASYILGLIPETQHGTADAGVFSLVGDSYKATISITTPYVDTQYGIFFDGEDLRTFTFESKTYNSFVINTNSPDPLTGNVDWQTVYKNLIQTDPIIGFVSGSDFIGNVKEYTVLLGTALPSTTYTVLLDAEDARTWTFRSKDTGSFVIESNSEEAMTGMVNWYILL